VVEPAFPLDGEQSETLTLYYTIRVSVSSAAVLSPASPPPPPPDVRGHDQSQGGRWRWRRRDPSSSSSQAADGSTTPRGLVHARLDPRPPRACHTAAASASPQTPRPIMAVAPSVDAEELIACMAVPSPVPNPQLGIGDTGSQRLPPLCVVPPASVASGPGPDACIRDSGSDNNPPAQSPKNTVLRRRRSWHWKGTLRFFLRCTRWWGLWRPVGQRNLFLPPWSGFGAQEQDLVSSLGHLTVQENRMSPETVQEEDPRGCAHDTDMRADAGVVLRGPAAAPTTALPRTFTHVYTRKRRCRKNQD